MSRAGAYVQHCRRWGALGLAVVVALTAFSGEASARKRKHRPAATQSYQPPYASIVVDVNSGEVMQATNADTPRHPASLTKIMTLYMLFERLEAGKIKLTTELPVSPHAAAQAPSKLALKPGETIQVETAIRAVVTKSANDVAVIIAEALGGDEPNFARLMTVKARALGMRNTTYRNASGLPDDDQITTARDQAVLGRAIQDRFPQYYRYFSTREFVFRGRAMRNHNRLLGNVTGVDGIKTGYIRASGFNIVTSARRGNRHIVAVVFGGSTAAARDARVRGLIDHNVNIASVKRTAPQIVEGWDSKVQVASSPPVPIKDPREQVAVSPASKEGPALGSTDPIKPNAVKTFTVHPGSIRTASLSPPSLSPMPSDSRKLVPSPASANAKVTNIATVKSEPPAPPPGAKPGVLGVLPAKPTQVASAGGHVPVPAATAELTAKPRGGWMIQVGAFDDETDAKQRLSAAQIKAKEQLGQADPFTEKVAKGDRSLYRARFAGLDKDQAENACKHLKRSEIPCMMLKN